MNLEPLEELERLHFRDLLRTARAAASADAEGSHEITIAVEQLGARLCGTAKAGLGRYRDELAAFVRPGTDRDDFIALFEVVRVGRNAAIHGGAYARHLAARAAELALILEAELMSNLGRIKHYMVRDPVCAQPWHSLNHVRQQMLLNSFSYLPIYASDPLVVSAEPRWWLVSDRAVASALLSAGSDFNRRSAASVLSSWKSGFLQVEDAPTLCPNDELQSALTKMGARPGLIVDPERPSALLGMATPFDLL